MSINSYTIRVDGAPYLGESKETEKADYGGNGWHIKNKIERNKLILGDLTDRPMEIVGVINLGSHIERILARLQDGTFVASKIEIEVEE